jgi:hypothetical protein
MRGAFPRRRELVLADRLCKQSARICAPGELRIRGDALAAVEHPQGLEVRGPTLRRVEVAREREHGRVVERRLAMRIAAGGEDEERTANGGVAFVLGEVEGLAGEVCEDDGLDVR